MHANFINIKTHRIYDEYDLVRNDVAVIALQTY